MSRKSERRARRQAMNELLARHEPRSRLDQLDHHDKVLEQDSTGPPAGTTEPVPPTHELQIPEQAGPPTSETVSDRSAQHP